MDKQSISGIYAIVNKINNKKYIGSSKSIYHRWNHGHLVNLKQGIHGNRHLQNSWKKYKESNFELQLIEECEECLLLKREGHWIEHYRSWEREYGYNFTRIINGEQIRGSRKPTAYNKTDLDKKTIHLFNEGISKNSIAVQLGITRSAVYSCLEQNGLHKNIGKGSKVKLTKEIKQKVKILRDKGKSWKEISKEVGVSKTQLYRSGSAKRDGKYGGNVNRDNYRTVTPTIIEEAKKIRKEENLTWDEIGSRLKVSRETLYSHGINEGFKPIRKIKSRSFMTEEKKQQAIKLRKQGKTWNYITKEIGVCLSTLRNHKKNWNVY